MFTALYYCKGGQILQEFVLTSNNGLSSGHFVGSGVVMLIFEVALVVLVDITALVALTPKKLEHLTDAVAEQTSHCLVPRLNSIFAVAISAILFNFSH